MIDVEHREHQFSNALLTHLYMISNIPVKSSNTNLPHVSRRKAKRQVTSQPCAGKEGSFVAEVVFFRLY